MVYFHDYFGIFKQEIIYNSKFNIKCVISHRTITLNLSIVWL